MLSDVGLLNGITATGVFIFSILFGLFFIYKSRKTGAKLILYLGFVYFFAGLVYIGDVLDFITILVTGQNVESFWIIGLIDWMWFPGAVVTAMYIGAELLIPDKKRYIFFAYLGLGILFEIFLFLFLSESVSYVLPSKPGEDLINDQITFPSIAFIIAAIFLISVLILLGFGFLLRGIQTTGDIRKKFFFLSTGAFLYIIGGILDGLFYIGFLLIFIRAAMILSAWLFYLGLKEK